MLELTKENFARTVETGTVIIDFWAAWCGPCRAFAPIFEAASQRHEGIVFGKVDTDAQPELAAAFDITSIPTLVIMRDRIVLVAQPGVVPAAALDSIIQQVQALDMDKIREELAAEAGTKTTRPIAQGSSQGEP